MSKDLQREWLKINRLCKEVRWLKYDPDYKEIDLDTALKILEQLKNKIGGELDENR
jgi:hypothetical protein